MYTRYAAALSAADAAAQKDDAACLARLQAAAASAAVLRPSRLAELPSASPAVRSRALGAVVGAACADAASMSTHWVYDTAKLCAMVSGRDAAFLDPPADAFYKYQLGSPSPYGQQAAALLHSLVETGGFSPEAYAARTFATFGAPAFTAGGGYLDGSTKGFLRAVRAGAGWPDCGVPDDQANAVARLPPLVAAYAGDRQLLTAVEQMVRVTQNSDIAVAWGTAAARVLEAVILGAKPADAVGLAIRQLRDPARARPGELDAQVADAMDAAVALAGATHADAVTQLGRNCHLPGSAQSPMHATLTTTRRDDGASAYQAAVMDTILQARACFAATALLHCAHATLMRRAAATPRAPALWAPASARRTAWTRCLLRGVPSFRSMRSRWSAPKRCSRCATSAADVRV
jgi:hypothetical protein